MNQEPISVLTLNQRLSAAVAAAPNLRNVWVVGETSDVRTAAGGHCYLELVEKGSDGSNVSRIRANIWASTFSRLSRAFTAGTGIAFASGIKVLVCVSASYHPTYGMSVTVNDIDPTYTAGDALRRRKEILDRLQREGILQKNLQRPWQRVPNRIAIVSAQGAAGFDDFVTHLFSNPWFFRFKVDLFPAVMQGDRTVPTVLKALADIAAKADQYDAVVVIRGGGATTDLAAFDNYDLAAAIANFPLPVIVGIGHERDTTVLDSVANLRVKTPTAAAEAIINRVAVFYDTLSRAADKIYTAASERIAAHRELLAHASASIPGWTMQNLMARKNVLERAMFSITNVVAASVGARSEQLNVLAANITSSASRAIERTSDRLKRDEQLLSVLSPDAVLSRGFSLTMLPDGKVLKNPADAPKGTELTTRVAGGTVSSVVTESGQPRLL